MIELYSKPIPQTAWHMQIKEEIQSSKRPIDRMAIAEIVKMYEELNFLCDICGNKLQHGNKLTLTEHIIHLINPAFKITCEDCFQDDLRKGRIIAMCREKIENWQIQDK